MAARNVAEFSNSEVPVREISAPKWEQKRPAASKQRQGERKSEQARRCYRCDSDKHMANSTQCPATNKICKSCGKTGHFAKVCRSEQKREVREVVIPELTVLLLNNSAPKEKKIMCTVDLGLSPANQSFEMIVDTGSSVSLLPAHVYETYFSHIPLKPTKVPLVTYSRQRIPVLGKLHLRAFHDGNTASATLFIVKSGSILLGLDLFEALEMVIMRNRVVLKSEQTFSEPLKVTKQKGPHSYTLDNGKTWDASHLSVLPETFTPPSEEVRPAEPATVHGAQSRNQRIRKQPVWIEDYVT
ncbi:hypothetical protein F7725_012079 [Dissostichus mawsoni]|uniref:CCHC-type domain-containing protein n=3 Tax=Dissostichus mawsoni TaxID=36200 RepID=A0A7J5ZET7_DISMA|nr:hypothetical protein F7725_012079 [Dissostichus mawsoni]